MIGCDMMIHLLEIEKIVAENLYRMRNTHKKGREYLFLQTPEGTRINGLWKPTEEKFDLSQFSYIPHQIPQ